MHVQPLYIQIPTAASFSTQQLPNSVVPVKRGRSERAIIPQNPVMKCRGAQACHTVPGGNPSLPPPQ